MKTLHAVRGFPPAVRLLLVNQLGVNTGFYLLIPYLATHLSQDLGMSAAVVGIVLGMRNLSQQGLFVIGGSAADRLGARGVIIAGCALRTVGFGLFALGDGLPVLLAASVVSGLAGALFNPAVRTYVSQEAGGRRAEAFALFNVFATAGALLGPLLGSLLLLVDFRAAALTAAAIFALLTVAQAAVLPAREVPAASGSVLGDWREAVANRRFLLFSLAMVGMYGMENQLYLLLPDGARRATGWEGAVGLLFLAGTVTNLLLQVRITRRLKGRGSGARWIGAGLAVMGLAFLPPMLVAGGPEPRGAADAALHLLPVLAGALMLHLGLMIAQPFVMELIPAFGRAGLTGTYYGLFYGVSGIAAAGGNAAIGWAMDSAGHSGRAWLPWACCLALGLTSAAAVTRLHRMRALPVPATAGLAADLAADSAPIRAVSRQRSESR
ncbi:MFS transporter [Streptomyces lunaelactis]|uniref:MFS transporter n=1 Tax=Streptomyces lunaelactis TaxID=1535768 RepID=UPI001585B191|nr:MFS transporter [Streptomyces lunaelactis]NUK33150.1 MFS transporter [Streptomyces lunaelactis]NUK40715.1 MFS transporter [Streptomyces lunaelactis]NUK93762.1 MFS transporter [Streptomyces lunaelactis]NUL29500.1 MFS transporter [Streptomyces lunaelactis]